MLTPQLVVAILLPWYTLAFLPTTNKGAPLAHHHRQHQLPQLGQLWLGRRVAVEQYEADSERPADLSYAPAGFLKAKELVIDELQFDATVFELLVQFNIDDSILSHCDFDLLEAIGISPVDAKKIIQALEAGFMTESLEVSPEWLLSECSSLFEQQGLATWSLAEKSALNRQDDAAAEEKAASSLLDAVCGPAGASCTASRAACEMAFSAERVEDVLKTVPMLSSEECAVLRAHVDAEVEAELALDNLDDLPDFQVNVDLEGLRTLLCPETVDSLEQLPRRCFGKAEEVGVPQTWHAVTIFLRRYTPTTRPYLPWHTDTNAFTANIALSHPNDHGGGKLRCVVARKIATLDRRLGDATVHGSNVAHAVSPVVTGKRYSMLCFFHDASTAQSEADFFQAQQADP